LLVLSLRFDKVLLYQLTLIEVINMLNGIRSIHQAVAEGDLAAVEAYLHEPEANPNASDQWGNTLLIMAAENGHTDIVALLLAKDADPNAPDQEGNTPLLWAAENGHTDIVALLLAKDADPNASGQWGNIPLLWAVQHCDTEMVALLLAKDADPNASDQEGDTPLYKAVRKGNIPILHTLIEKMDCKQARDSLQQMRAMLSRPAPMFGTLDPLEVNQLEVVVKAKERKEAKIQAIQACCPDQPSPSRQAIESWLDMSSDQRTFYIALASGRYGQGGGAEAASAPHELHDFTKLPTELREAIIDAWSSIQNDPKLSEVRRFSLFFKTPDETSKIISSLNQDRQRISLG
jgi:Ankyrin repeats (3 copies)/Ankyrin repeats (many copies)